MIKEYSGESFTDISKGKEFIRLASSDRVRVYILDDHYAKKPFGAGGGCISFSMWMSSRERSLYDARILPDGRIDFPENSGYY